MLEILLGSDYWKYLGLLSFAALLVNLLVYIYLGTGKRACARFGHMWCAYDLEHDKCLRCNAERKVPVLTHDRG